MKKEPTHIDQTLLTRYLAGEANAAEQQQVEAWREAAAENQEAFEHWHFLWQVAEAPPEHRATTPSAKAKAALQKVQQRINSEEKVVRVSKSRFPWLAAAGIALLLGVWWIIALFNADPATTTLFSEQEVQELTLPDGTHITLNKNSSLTYPEQFGDTREVTLSGEAYFDVERDTLHPFIIHLDEAEVMVLGTSFNIAAYPDAANHVVSVTSGKVRLAYATANIDLIAGEAGEFDTGSKRVRKATQFDPTALYWDDKTLVFEEVELKEVLDLLGKLFNERIAVTNDAIHNCTLSATFKNEDLENILNVISRTFGLDLTYDGSQFTLTGDGCP